LEDIKKRGDLRTYYRTRDIGGAAEERYIRSKEIFITIFTKKGYE